MDPLSSQSPFTAWLDTLVNANASDLHLGAGRPPMMRVNGRLAALAAEPLQAEVLDSLIQSLVPDRLHEELDGEGGADFSFSHGAERYRAAAFRQRGSLALVLRRIPAHRMSFEEIGAPAVMKMLARRPRGLILVTGPTGSGKTTTLAALLHEINTSFDRHIVTVEDPIEFYHESDKSIVVQREIGDDVVSFAEALRRVLRQDPDVILVGELRDLETTSAAITAAETGHLVMGTLHTTGAARTVDRIIDQFPTDQQEQVRTQLASSILAVISQVLLPRIDTEGRVAAFEVMVRNTAIENHIRKGETFKIPSVMQTSRKLGMQLLDENLFELVRGGKVALEDALEVAQSPADLSRRLGAD